MSLISRLFKIIKKANLEDDMAKRIMYSLSLSKANKMEIEHNLGNANLDMLDAAVEGVDDIIRYGALSVLNELARCKITDEIKDKSIIDFLLEIKDIDTKDIALLEGLYFGEEYNKSYYNNVINILLKSIKLFSNENLWNSRTGGERWAKIAKSIYTLANLKINLFDTKEEQAIKIKKQIVLELNYFDSLAHNTGSIYTTLVGLENIKLNNTNYNNYNKKVNNINTLMDSKDLKDSNQLYSILHPYISGTTKLQFRDALNNFNRFLSPEEEDNKLLELNKTRLSRIGLYDEINKLKFFIKKKVQDKINNNYLTIVQNIKDYLNNKISNEFNKRLKIVEDHILKLKNISDLILPETNGMTIKEFVLINKQDAVVLNKINEIYNNKAKFIISMLEALII